MNTQRSTLHVRLVIASAIAVLALAATAALAQVPATTEFFFSSHPMISGTVVTVNDREIAVDTDQGERVVLLVDSRTMAPRDLAPGMVMRAEFLALEDCRFYAQRIMPLRGGMSATRMQAYANTHDSHEAIERSTWTEAEHAEHRADADRPRNAPQTLTAYAPGRTMTATPTTADYRLSTRPMISGRVIAVNDHRLVIVTDQGQQVGLVMDSRTMLPRDVDPGSVIRGDFTQMDDGRYLANRLTRIATGATDREQAYAHTLDNDFAIDQDGSDCWSAGDRDRDRDGDRVRTTSALESADPPTMVRREPVSSPEPVAVQNTPERVVATPPVLPQTASREPLILLLGLLSLGGAGVVAVARGLRNA